MFNEFHVEISLYSQFCLTVNQKKSASPVTGNLSPFEFIHVSINSSLLLAKLKYLGMFKKSVPYLRLFLQSCFVVTSACGVRFVMVHQYPSCVSDTRLISEELIYARHQ